MASIGKAIYARLSTDAGVAGITTTIVPDYAPKRSTYPQVIYEKKNQENDKTYSGSSGLAKADVTIRCECRSNYADRALGYKQCDALAAAVRAALDDQGGVWGGITVQRAFLNEDTDDEFTDATSEQLLFFVRELTFEIWFNDT